VRGERLVAGLRCSEVLAELSEYLDGGLPVARREQIETHVRGCAFCEEFGGRFSAVVQLLRRRLAVPEPLDVEVAARLRDRLRRDIPPQ
jgi:anti-sigma factor RsiW